MTSSTDQKTAARETSRRGARRTLALVLAATLALDMTASTLVAAERTKVPVPRANPGRASVDAIGSIISSGPEEAVAPAEDAATLSYASPSDAIPSQDATPPLAASPALVAAPRSAVSALGFNVAVKLLDAKDYSAALLAARALPDPVDAKLITWLALSDTGPGLASARITEFGRLLNGWPAQTLVRRRFEQALARENPPANTIIQALGGRRPASDDGLTLLAGAYVTAGRRAEAAALVSAAWRDTSSSDQLIATLRAEFGNLLTTADKKYRLDSLLYAEKLSLVPRAAAALGKDQEALAAAVMAVMKKGGNAGALLNNLPTSVRNDPLALFARIQLLRRDEKFAEAGRLMMQAPRDPKSIVDPDAWWVERRIVSRGLIDLGDPQTAYRIAAAHAAETPSLQAEAEFHAGWYALEFMHDPRTARPHFERIQSISKMPLSQSRAEYWLGRTAAAAGDKAEAINQFKRAGAYPTTFYGQLALASLGVKRLPLRPPPAASAAARKTFESLELVQAILRLKQANRADRADVFYRYLSEELNDPIQIALLADLAEKSGKHQVALQIGKTAAQRGLPVETLAFPTTAIPASAKTPRVEKSMVYAIARQESAFNPGAVSSAGARGLLQLMPATAKHVASSVGLPFNKLRLTSDPAYNATLGAAHLGELVDEFSGSYIMTFASYNAGRSRVYAWMKKYGDPRDPSVDAVNWVERIPFTETRNYVQRVMENVQVYRSRLGVPSLTIEADLRRGGG